MDVKLCIETSALWTVLDHMGLEKSTTECRVNVPPH